MSEERRTVRKTKMKTILLTLYDAIVSIASYFIALWVRYDFSIGTIPNKSLLAVLYVAAPYALLVVLIFTLFRLYKTIWTYVGISELLRLFIASLVASAVHSIAVTIVSFVISGHRMPISYYVIGGFSQIAFTAGIRLAAKTFSYLKRHSRRDIKTRERVLIYGAGSAGYAIARDIENDREDRIVIVGFIDDDPSKKGYSIGNHSILGTRENLKSIVEDYAVDRILLAIPSLSPKQQKTILNLCKDTNVQVSLLPSTNMLVGGRITTDKVRDIQIEDLLGREKVDINSTDAFSIIQNKVILVTGGGGSIGSELCRQIISHNPKQLIIFDIYENNAYDIQQELIRKFPDLDLKVLIGSVRDSRRINDVFEKYHPDIVYHAAAHKHVPLMEESPEEAVKNNIIGTYKAAYAAIKHHVGKFILISTDKAVNPTSIMGMTKRVCEMIIQTMDAMIRSHRVADIPAIYTHYEDNNTNETTALPADATTEFSAVRFGNVLGSNGSVIPLFKKQIEEGGPVTVTHPDIVRYFMTIPEAVSLVLQASAFAHGGEIFVLDMGQPVKVDTLARNMIILAGYKPDVDIKIVYTGLRPGEKMYEEKLMASEGLRKTNHGRIYIGKPIDFDREGFFENLRELLSISFKDEEETKARILAFVNRGLGEKAGLNEEVIEREKADIEEISGIVRNFRLKGKLVKVLPIIKGYINRTYYIETLDDAEEMHQYVLQRINDNVFKDPKGLMDNFEKVTKELSGKFILPGAEKRELGESSIPSVCKTNTDENLIHIESGWWRVISYFPDVYGIDVVTNPETFYFAGVAYGSFINAVSGMDATKLNITIPNFHNCPSRYRDLQSSIAKDVKDRKKDVEKEIAFIEERSEKIGCIHNALESKRIPTRICHNDTNLNNVLFDNETHLPVAVIDLDTIMPSSPLYDFGDSMRIGASTAKDDEKDLSKVKFNVGLYKYYAKGFLETCGASLTKEELELLPNASLVMSMEDGIRFLADYLDGDTYYRIEYSSQNLDRCRTQLKMVEEMEKVLPEIRATLQEIYDELNLTADLSTNVGW